MKSVKNALFATLVIIGGFTSMLFVFQFAKANILPSDGSLGHFLAVYPPPGSTEVYTLITTPTLLPTQNPTPTPIVLENGWYLYIDPDNEFTFAYPPNSIITAGQNPVDLSKNINIQFRLPNKPYQGMSIRVELNLTRLQGVDLAIKYFEESAQQQAPAEFVNSLIPFSIGEMMAIQAFIPSANTEITIIASYGDKALFLAPVHDSAETIVEKESLELFYQVLTTFKFNTSK